MTDPGALIPEEPTQADEPAPPPSLPDEPSAGPDDGATMPHRYPPPVAPAASIAPSSVSQALPEPALESTPDLRRSMAPQADEDDFLMGRSDGGIRMQPNVIGWLLVAFGLMCGLIGAALIVFAAARYKGLL